MSGMHKQPKAFIVIGLGYGDEGKGSWVDHLVRTHEAKYVVRFNGGVQALHHVVLPDGRYHGFKQLSSGSFVPGTQTLLSRFMLLEPEELLREVEKLEELGVDDPLSQVTISENAPIVTPFNRLLNQIQECYRNQDRHGSCGWGIGITQGDVENLGEKALYLRDFAEDELFDKLRWLAEQKLAEARKYACPETAELIEIIEHVDLEHYVEFYQDFYQQVRVVSERIFQGLLKNETVVFEGAQGVLLDQQYGFFPHVTRSNCTFENALTLLRESNYSGEVTRIGLLRGYATRHGAGPFVTEQPDLDIPPCHNKLDLWQGEFRHGWFDAVSAKYALEVVGGVDCLAITNLDRMAALEEIKVAVSYGNTCGEYFREDGTIRLIHTDITKLSGRVDALEQVTPHYKEHCGFGRSKAGIEAYLDFLAQQLGTPVSAYSATDSNCKVYR